MTRQNYKLIKYFKFKTIQFGSFYVIICGQMDGLQWFFIYIIRNTPYKIRWANQVHYIRNCSDGRTLVVLAKKSFFESWSIHFLPIWKFRYRVKEYCELFSNYISIKLKSRILDSNLHSCLRIFVICLELKKYIKSVFIMDGA